MGANPDAGSAGKDTRGREMWESLERVTKVCRGEKVDVLLVAGDLFHRQPLLRELKEVNYLFASMEETQVILIAGNHDYLKKDSYYHTFAWAPNVHMILSEEISCVELPELELAVYGCSYYSREIAEEKYQGIHAKHCQKYEILLAHGGDEKHIPIKKNDIVSLGYDYVALGHIHKPQIFEPYPMAYAGALEPIDKNDMGGHGYIKGELTEQGCQFEFVKSALREYISMEIVVDKETTGYELRGKIEEAIAGCGCRNLYKIRIIGQRSPETLYDLSAMDPYGNIVELKDETRPAYDYEKLMKQNGENLLGRFVQSLKDSEEDSIEYQALCAGVEALVETRRG